MQRFQSWSDWHSKDYAAQEVERVMQEFQESQGVKKYNDYSPGTHSLVSPDGSRRQAGHQNTEAARYLADKRGGEQEKLKQYQIQLEEYLKDLKEFQIVKDVYVLNDEREDDGVIGILIKLVPLMSIPAHVFDTENEKVTNYLKATGIIQAREIHVSFQYTEVF